MAFRIKISKEILEYCSELSSSDHGDARRALDLLRTAGEICNGITITKENIDSALKYLQKDRAEEIVSSAPYHMRCVAAAICSLAIVGEQAWAATSAIYKKYTEVLSSDNKPLSYRRVSDLLVELENSGLVVSRAYSRGRNGYGKEYKLKVSPDLVGPAVGKEYYDSLVKRKAQLDGIKEYEKTMKSLGRKPNWLLYSKLLRDA